MRNSEFAYDLFESLINHALLIPDWDQSGYLTSRGVKQDLFGDASIPSNSGTMQIQRSEEWRECHCRILDITLRPHELSYMRSYGANRDLCRSMWKLHRPLQIVMKNCVTSSTARVWALVKWKNITQESPSECILSYPYIYNPHLREKVCRIKISEKPRAICFGQNNILRKIHNAVKKKTEI